MMLMDVVDLPEDHRGMSCGGRDLTATLSEEQA